MKILYGVQGTGNGHITRARVMANAFAKRSDVHVDFLFSGRKPEHYFDMHDFPRYQTLEGLSFVTAKGAVNYWQTIKGLKLRQFYRDVNALDLSSYDLLLNDFEPVTAWAAKKQKIPSISISHQAAFTHPIPKKAISLLDKAILRYFAPTDIQLGVHWYHFDYPILPPFIDAEESRSNLSKSILVYLPFEDVALIQGALEMFAEHDFICFHPAIKATYTEQNISWNPTAKAPFKKALASCGGVIANAGFEMASECLHLNKKMLLKPLKGQCEQLSNAFTLEELGLCQLMQTLDVDAIEQWLQADSDAEVKFASDPNILIDWIVNKQWSDTQSLCTSLWQQVTFPPAMQRSLNQI